MAIRIFGILIGLFTITFTILGLQDPYSLDLKSLLNFKNIEALNLQVYELNNTTIRSYYKADSWMRYTNKDEFENFVHLNLDFNLSARSLKFKDKHNIILEGNVCYVDAKGMRVFAQEFEYELRNKILSTHTGFNALIGVNIIKGDILNYDLENKILKIERINAWLKR